MSETADCYISTVKPYWDLFQIFFFSNLLCELSDLNIEIRPAGYTKKKHFKMIILEFTGVTTTLHNRTHTCTFSGLTTAFLQKICCVNATVLEN